MRFLFFMMMTFLLSVGGLLRGSTPKEWTVDGIDIMYGNKKAYLRGLSWFGFETPDFVMNGLWLHDLDFYFTILSNLGINAIRVPFSSEWIYYNYDQYVNEALVSADPQCSHLQSIEILDLIFDKAEEKGIMILLDHHRLHKEYISELWYSPTDDAYTDDTFFATWYRILDRYIDRPNLLGIDLINEPHGQATFGGGGDTDWKQFVEYAVPVIIDHYPERRFLVFIEGINWGHTFDAYHAHPLNLAPSYLSQIVFSPHVYGRSVVPTTSEDPETLRSQWNEYFGFLDTDYDKVIIPGEWGGKTDIDQTWMNIFADYVVSKPIKSNFFWSLGPNSGDVGGLLLDDWSTLDQFKIDLLYKMVPNPTNFKSP